MRQQCKDRFGESSTLTANRAAVYLGLSHATHTHTQHIQHTHTLGFEDKSLWESRMFCFPLSSPMKAHTSGRRSGWFRPLVKKTRGKGRSLRLVGILAKSLPCGLFPLLQNELLGMFISNCSSIFNTGWPPRAVGPMRGSLRPHTMISGELRLAAPQT